MPELVDGTGTSITTSGGNISINSDLSDNTSNITVADGGTIGSTSDTDAITISATGDVALSQDLTIKDGGTIGSASDPDAITISATGDVALSQDLTIKDDGTIGSTSDPDAITISSGGLVTFGAGTFGVTPQDESFIVACSDETTDLTTGTAKATFRMPYEFTVSDVRASVTTAPVGSAIVVDINEEGTSILSTKLSIDASQKSSITASTVPVISDADLADDAEITIDIDQVGSSTAGTGLKVAVIGKKKLNFEFVRDNAVAAWSAGSYNGTIDSLIDLTGNGHHARLGSGVGADSNDPLLLSYTGEKYLYLPGATGNYASTPDSAALDITGDLDLRWYGALTDWTPGVNTHLIGNRVFGSSDGYSFSTTFSTDLLSLNIGGVAVTSTVTPTVANGQRLWVRVTLDSDNGAGGHDVKFYQSDDGVTWTQVGATVTGAGTLSATATTNPLTIGQRGVLNDWLWEGKVYRAQVYDGIDGTLVADFDSSRSVEPHTSFVADTGETWTINRSSTGRKAALVDRNLALFGTDDYLQVADHDDLDVTEGSELSAVLVCRWHSPLGEYAPVIGKTANAYSAGAPGWVMYTPARWRVTHGGVMYTIFSFSLVASPSARAVMGVVTSNSLSLYSTSNAVGQGFSSGDASNAAPLLIGRKGGLSEYSDMEFIGAAIFRRALSEKELTRVAYEFGVVQ